MFPVISSRTEDKGPIDKDGDGGDTTDVSTFLIEVGLNGYVLTVTFEDGTEEKTVHTDFNELLEAVRSYH